MYLDVSGFNSWREKEVLLIKLTFRTEPSLLLWGSAPQAQQAGMSGVVAKL